MKATPLFPSGVVEDAEKVKYWSGSCVPRAAAVAVLYCSWFFVDFFVPVLYCFSDRFFNVFG